jgi:predicted acetylornithine/succinylornithine family transaminase
MKEFIEIEKKYFLPTYRRLKVVFERGEGCYLFDRNNKRYLDFVSGIGVCSLGHNHPRLTAALKAQAEKLWHTSSLVYTLPQLELAERLVNKVGFAAKVFLANSGAEANEAAIKLVRYFSAKHNIANPRIISMENSFHGRTFACISASGQNKIKEGFYPLLDGFDFVKFNDIKALERLVTSSSVAILMEIIQGEGGVHPATPDFIQTISRIKRTYNLLLIIDEVQTGIGRTGKWFAFQHFPELSPDIITSAKGLGSGVPISCLIVKEELANYLPQGSHASTFGGNPLCCAVANEVLKVLEEEEIVERVAQLGVYIEERLKDLHRKLKDIIKEVRGLGLMWGLELSSPIAFQLVDKCLEEGLWINATSDFVIRLLPPLIIKKEEIAEGLSILTSIIQNTQTI